MWLHACAICLFTACEQSIVLPDFGLAAVQDRCSLSFVAMHSFSPLSGSATPVIVLVSLQACNGLFAENKLQPRNRQVNSGHSTRPQGMDPLQALAAAMNETASHIFSLTTPPPPACNLAVHILRPPTAATRSSAAVDGYVCAGCSRTQATTLIHHMYARKRERAQCANRGRPKCASM